MKAYKHCFNESTKKIDYIEYEISHEFDFEHEPETNLYDALDGHNCHIESTMEWIDNVNADLENGSLMIVKCKDCGIYFMLPQDEAVWFSDRGMMPPKRCPRCRKARKNEKTVEKTINEENK